MTNSMETMRKHTATEAMDWLELAMPVGDGGEWDRAVEFKWDEGHFKILRIRVLGGKFHSH
jgi:hypothetical protein